MQQTEKVRPIIHENTKELSGEDTTMQLKPEEISKIIRAQIKHYENVIEQREVGTVILVGDGIATSLAGMFGGPANTTYGENIGVMAITKVYSVWVIGGAAVFAILLSFIGKLSELIHSIPVPVMGGVCILLFGVIAASGLRVLVESKVDYSKSSNLVMTAVIMIIGLSGAKLTFGTISVQGMVLATLVAILLSVTFKILDRLGFLNHI